MRPGNLKYLVLGAALAVSSVYVLAVGVPHTFQPGAPIKASEVNQNFTTFKAAIDALEADGSVNLKKLKTKNEPGPGQVLSYDGEELAWRSVAGVTGVINSVAAGAGLTGGGVSGDVSLAVKPLGITNDLIAANTIRGEKIALPLALNAATSSPVFAVGNPGGAAAAFDGSVSVSRSLNFGSQTRQMLNLFGAQYGIGVQTDTQYFRSEKNFAWYRGGSHSDLPSSPGAGQTLMTLQPGSSDLGLLTVGRVLAGSLSSFTGIQAVDIEAAQTITAGSKVSAKEFVTTSDRAAKKQFAEVDAQEVLEKVVKLPIQTWNYKSDPDHLRHIGPMAQDFKAAFGLGADDKHISVVDGQGVALAAIQGLYRQVQAKESRIAELEERLGRLEQLLQTQTPRGNRP